MMCHLLTDSDMKIFLRLAVASVLLCAGMSCSGGGSHDPEEKTDAPDAITLTPSSFSTTSAGGSQSLVISSPSRPEVSCDAEWVGITDGPYNGSTFKKTITVMVAANPSYQDRSATLKVSASGVADASFIITQEAAEEPETPVTPEPGDNAAWQMSEALGLGWNMGNHMDAFHNGSWAGSNFLMPDETCWGNALATQATFDAVKAAGFKSVRIPVTWLRKIGDAPEYKIDETWLNRVYEIVEYAGKAGLYAIINTHHDENHHSITENGRDIDTRWQDILAASGSDAANQTIKAEIAAVWTHIANKFKDTGDWLIFEGFNEINDGGWGWSSDFLANPSKQCNILNEWNQTFVDAVRATGGGNASRWLGVPTYAANPSFEKYSTMPTDAAGKVMLSVHFYDPSAYTIGEEQYSDWGHTGASGKKASGGDEDHVLDVFGNLYTKYVSKGIPVYIGEFGCSMRAQSDTRAWKFYLYYMEYVVKAAKTYGMPCFLWDNGASGDGQEKHGYINHGTGAYIGNSKTVIDVMTNARYNDSESYTLDYVYSKAPIF